MMEILAVWIGLCIVVGYIASQRGRSGVGWFLFSVILSPILGFLVVIIIPSKAPSIAPKIVVTAKGLEDWGKKP